MLEKNKNGEVVLQVPGERTFRVCYFIDSFASTPEKACLEAEDFMKNGSFRPYFSVVDSNGNITDIDLEEQKVKK